MPVPFPKLIRSVESEGYGCFPVFCYKDGGRREKIPLVPWKSFQTARPSAEDMDRWCADGDMAEYAGVGIAVPDGVCVLDIDHPQYDPCGLLMTLPGMESVEPVVVRTPGGGIHAYFRVPERHGLRGWTAVPAFANGVAVLDLRVQGNYVVAPGSPLWPRRPPSSSSSAPMEPCGEYSGQLVAASDLPMLPTDTIACIRSAQAAKEREAGGRGKAYERALYSTVGEGDRHTVALSLSMECLIGVTEESELPESKELFLKYLSGKFENDASFNADSKEVRDIWDSAVRKKRAEWTANASSVQPPPCMYPSQSLSYSASCDASSAVPYSVTSGSDDGAKSVWPFAWDGDGKVYGDLVTARILFAGAERPTVVHIGARAFISQPAFREEFLKSVGTILPAIPSRAFHAVVSKLRISKVESRINLLAERLLTSIGEMLASERAVTETDDMGEMRRTMASSEFVKTTDPETGGASILFTVDSVRRLAGFTNEQPWTVDAALSCIGAVRRPVAEFGMDAYSYSVPEDDAVPDL